MVTRKIAPDFARNLSKKAQKTRNAKKALRRVMKMKASQSVKSFKLHGWTEWARIRTNHSKKAPPVWKLTSPSLEPITTEIQR